MATYVLIHGGGSTAACWDLVSEELRQHGHEAVAVDLPSDNPDATWDEYAKTVINAASGRNNLIVVGHSMGAFTASLVAEHIPTKLLIYVAGMVPLPGEEFMQWWTNTDYSEAKRVQLELDGRSPDEEEDVYQSYYHDVPRELADADIARGEGRENAPSGPLPLQALPDVLTRFLVCSDDGFFPEPLMRRVAQERLGVKPDEIAGSHMPMLARPEELVDSFETFRLEAAVVD